MRKTWIVIKEVIGKTKLKSSTLPRRLIIDGIETYDKNLIANRFNNYFTSIGETLASKIPKSTRTYESYLTKHNSDLEMQDLTENELKNGFYSLKPNKSSGFDNISARTILQCYESLKAPLKYIFNLSLNTGDVPNNLKIAKVTPIHKTGEKAETSNYRPISVLPCFSKILERIMYNRVYNFITKNNLLYEKQFGFQAKHSTDHAILELSNEIYQNFSDNKFTLGVFIDLSKAFDTVNHDILLKKLTFYGINNLYLTWFKSYLSGRTQYIQYDNSKTEMVNISCGVPQGSILGPLLFLIYVNDLKSS